MEYSKKQVMEDDQTQERICMISLYFMQVTGLQPFTFTFTGFRKHAACRVPGFVTTSAKWRRQWSNNIIEAEGHVDVEFRSETGIHAAL